MSLWVCIKSLFAFEGGSRLQNYFLLKQHLLKTSFEKRVAYRFVEKRVDRIFPRLGDLGVRFGDLGCVSPGVVDTDILREMKRKAIESSKSYRSFQMLSRNDIAGAVIAILESPQHVDINEIIVRSYKEQG